MKLTLLSVRVLSIFVLFLILIHRNLQQEVMSKTNLFLFTNEMDLGSSNTAHSLNQSHDGGFSGGTKSGGFITTRAHIIGSSNSTTVHERYKFFCT